MAYPLIDGPNFVSQGYGCTDYQGEWLVSASRCAAQRFHTGIDVASSCGLPILAMRAGTIVRIGIEYLGPSAVGICDDDGLFHVYGHCSSPRMAVGDRVEAGEWIANVDTLGQSTGCHVHYAVHTDGAFEAPVNTLDPVPFLEGFMALVDEVRALAKTVGEIHNMLNWGTPVGGAVPQGWMATQVAKVANVDARTGEIHNMVNWGTPVGGAVPQGWVPSRLDDIQKELDAIKQKLGA
jgi:hypothetical protein